ncbi:MAG: ABC transporter permease [Acidobacteriota bacterium]|nr:ABC transporter permease [Acidobacteriota bacterium]
MSRLLQDVRFALRVVVRNRFVSGLAILAFALGIGVTTAVFSIFNSVLLKPLPYPGSDRIVLIYDTQPACTSCPASFEKYSDWKARNTSFAAVGGSTPGAVTLTGTGSPERVQALSTTASLGAVLGVQPAMGRWYRDDEDQPGAHKVVVVGHTFWRTQLSADQAVLGKKLMLDGTPHEVIGVMPEGFAYRAALLYMPLARKADPTRRGNHFLLTYARLRDGVTVAQAQQEMRAMGQSLASEFGNNHGVDVQSYYEVVVGSIREPLQILMGAVLLVLLIACANVSNLLLASGLARRRELAIRLALGAKTRDLARQLTIESVVLALIGGGIGVLLAQWAVKTFVFLAGTQLPRGATVSIDGRVLAFAAGVSLAVGVFCGLWPLMRLRVRELAQAVRETDTRTTSGAGKRFGNGLVVAEIAVAFTLLVGAALLVKNFMLLQARDAGITTERIVAFDVAPSGPRYQAPAQIRAFYRELGARLQQIGGAEQVGFVSHLPMYRFGMNGEFQLEGALPWDANKAPLVEYRWVHGDYFKALDIALVKGRMLDARDGDNTRTVLVNQTMAEKFWPGQDPVGRRFGQGTDRSLWFEVVGVLTDVRSYGLTGQQPYEFYRTIDQSAYAGMTGVIRTTAADPTAIVPTVRQMVAAIDPSMPVTGVQTMEQVVAASVGQPRLMSALTGVFGVLAGLLAMVGVYGVMAYNVRSQRREFGIRLALGADAASVRKLVVGRGLVLAVAGVAAGAAGSWMLTGLLDSMLNDVKPNDPAVFGATAAGVFLVALLASWLPARSASRVDPMVVLRDA